MKQKTLVGKDRMIVNTIPDKDPVLIKSQEELEEFFGLPDHNNPLGKLCKCVLERLSSEQEEKRI